MGIYIYHTPNQGDLGVQRNLGVGPTHSFSKFGLLLYFLNFQTLYWHTADEISQSTAVELPFQRRFYVLT